MKEIIVHGTMRETYIKRFKCNRCGCVFETSNPADYFKSIMTSTNRSECPECDDLADEIERHVTCREKLINEQPSSIGNEWTGGCRGCPSDYGYAEDPLYCDGGSNYSCTQCWDRPVSD